MKVDSAYNYDRIQARSEELDRLLELASDGFEEWEEWKSGEILAARLENKKIQALAVESIREIEYNLLMDENVTLQGENLDLRSELSEMDTELGELRAKSATTEDKAPPGVGWMSGGYNLPEDIPTTNDTVDPDSTYPRQTMLTTEELIEGAKESSQDKNDYWPKWLTFEKGDRVRDTVSEQEGEIVGWSETTDRYRIIYSMSTGSGHDIEGLSEEFVKLEKAPKAEIGTALEDDDYDRTSWGWFD